MTALVLDIITTAAILFAVASGLLIILGVLKIVNFAHGGFLTIGGYSGLVVTQLGWNAWLAYPVAGVAGILLGAVVERFIIRPLYDRPLDAILATWGLGIIIGQLITIVFGREIQFVQAPITGATSVIGETYSLYRLFLIAAAAMVAGGIATLLNATRLGLEARAVIMNEQLARGLGINSGHVRFVTFCIGAGLASLAGALITPLSSVDPNMGVPWLVNAFMLVLVSSVARKSRDRGAHAWRCTGACFHLHQPGDWRTDHRGSRSPASAYPARGVRQWLTSPRHLKTLPRQTCSGRLCAGLIAGLCVAAIIAGPYLLDAYTVNILVRSFLYAATALTVDILWGYAGILTFGQAAFFGIGAKPLPASPSPTWTSRRKPRCWRS